MFGGRGVRRGRSARRRLGGLVLDLEVKGRGKSLHLVTCTACLAKPARFHTNDPSLGRSFGTSLLTSL